MILYKPSSGTRFQIQISALRCKPLSDRAREYISFLLLKKLRFL
jgi:hypothetical protein